MTADQFAADVDQLVTGEAVALELPPASVGVRLVSGLIDMTIQVGVLVLGSFVAALLAPDEALGAVAAIVLVAFTWSSVRPRSRRSRRAERSASS